VDRIAQIRYFARLVEQNGVDLDVAPLAINEQYHFVDVALVTLYSWPDPYLLEESYGTLISCTKLGEESLCVINLTSICSVVGMVPHRVNLPEALEERFFLVQKMGIELAHVGADPDDEDI